jgi:hypothetical protein
MTDLEGYGGEPQGAEAELRRRLGEHDFLVDLFQLGEQMQGFIETPAGAFLFKTLQDNVNSGLKGLLGEPSCDTESARKLFAQAKTSWTALSLIQETLQMGRVATRMMSEMDEVTP